jgi:hypothetical protein
MTYKRDDCGMRKVSQEDIDALNALVQDGLVEIVSIDEDGEPSYRLASRFTVVEALPEPQEAQRSPDSNPLARLFEFG